MSAVASYAVVWEQPDGILNTGRLTVAADGLHLDGARQKTRQLASLLVHSRDISGVRVGRADRERIGGQPALVLELTNGTALTISAPGPGMLSEIADLVTALQTEDIRAAAPILVVVPLRKGKSEQARKLIAEGPPFDPVAVGLEHHDVFVTDNEVVFLFQGPDAQEITSRLLADSTLWRGAVAWRGLIAGKPRVASHTYAWAR